MTDNVLHEQPMSNRMGRPQREDRESVAGTTLTIRLTTGEKEGLERIVDHRQSELRRAYGPGFNLSMAGFIRSIIAREVEAFEKTSPQPTPAPEQPVVTKQERETVLQAIAGLAPKHRKLVPIPEVRQALPSMSKPMLDAALLELEDIGNCALKEANDPTQVDQTQGIDMRPDRGLLYFVSVHNAAEQPTGHLNADDVHKRVDHALDKLRLFRTQADLAERAGLHPNDVSRLRKGVNLSVGKLEAIDAALKAKGA